MEHVWHTTVQASAHLEMRRYFCTAVPGRSKCRPSYLKDILTSSITLEDVFIYLHVLADKSGLPLCTTMGETPSVTLYASFGSS
jgi:hypothetical protein